VDTLDLANVILSGSASVSVSVPLYISASVNDMVSVVLSWPDSSAKMMNIFF